MSLPTDARRWIEHLDLQPHPEGGFYREVYRGPQVTVRGDEGTERNLATATSIYYLLGAGSVSRLHRLGADELWFHQAGAALCVHIFAEDGSYSPVTIGPDPTRGESLFGAVTAGSWFGATVESDYALVSCVVAPGFEFSDFELADRNALLTRFPQHRSLILELT